MVAHPARLCPPDPDGLYAGFRFGRQGGGEDEEGGYPQELSSAEGQLGGDGTVTAVQPLAEGRPGQVYRYELNATVEDVDRQAVSKQAGVQVFTSGLLIGARLTRGPGDGEPLYFVGEKEPFTLTACLVRPDGSAFRPEGSPAAGRLEGRLLRESWKMVRERSIGGRLDTRWVREELEEGRFSLEPGAADERGRVLAQGSCAPPRWATTSWSCAGGTRPAARRSPAWGCTPPAPEACCGGAPTRTASSWWPTGPPTGPASGPACW